MKSQLTTHLAVSCIVEAGGKSKAQIGSGVEYARSDTQASSTKQKRTNALNAVSMRSYIKPSRYQRDRTCSPGNRTKRKQRLEADVS